MSRAVKSATTKTRTHFLDLFLSNNGNNRTGWKNARFDGLIREANSEFDAKSRPLAIPSER